MTGQGLYELIDKAYLNGGVKGLSAALKQYRQQYPKAFEQYQEIARAEDERLSKETGCPTVESIMSEVFPDEDSVKRFKENLDNGTIAARAKEEKAQITEWREK